MKIGMILDKTFPPDPRVENEAISLIENGHEVLLFCLNYENGPEFEIINGIQVHRYAASKLIYKLSALAYSFPFYTWRMCSKLVDFISINKVEALHIHDIRIAGAVFKANNKFELPVVLDLHDNMPEIMKLYPHLQKFPGKQLIDPAIWKEKEEQFIRDATKIITVSQEFIEEVISRTTVAPEKMVLVPNTVHRSFYKNAIIDSAILKAYRDQFVILYLGDTGLRRGLQTAIRSLAILKSTISNIKLVIVGKNTTDVVLKKLAKELQVEAHVDFVGWKDVSLFPSFIKSSDICISPLHRNIQHDVAYANKLFQYMSFGKPLLVSDATAQKNLIQKTETGLVHKSEDSEDFAKKTIELFQDAKLREKYGENGKRFVDEEFCWEKTSKNLVALYGKLES